MEKRFKAGEKKERKFIGEITEAGARNSTIRPVDLKKIRSKSLMPRIPQYYEDKTFNRVDCGSQQIWTARKQKWWHETAGGDIESTANRCRNCRRNERDRKARARKTHLEGIARKSKESEKTS